MQVWMLYHSSMSNGNHFTPVTKHVYHVSYSWTSLNAIMLRFCPIICLYVLSSVFWCPLRFLHETMFGSSSPPVVSSKAHVLFTLFVFVYSGVQHILCCVFVFLCLVYPILSIPLDCPYLIDPLVISNVYLFKYVNS
jgi:hypothetical protein